MITVTPHVRYFLTWREEARIKPDTKATPASQVEQYNGPLWAVVDSRSVGQSATVRSK